MNIKKLFAITGIIGMTAFAGFPAMAQETPTTTEPNTTETTPGTTTTPGATNNQATGNLIEIAASNQSFSTLATAVQAAGLEDTLAQGNYTIFAPTNEAFQASLPAGAVEFLLRPENRDLLRQVLTYHVVNGEVTSNDLSTGPVRTLGGGVAVRVTPERVIVNDGSVTQADIRANNGVIHAVNRVLLPSQLRQTIASRLGAQ
jgi:uncharacterized surface protein with fasciclin (FAS1) repeats